MPRPIHAKRYGKTGDTEIAARMDVIHQDRLDAAVFSVSPAPEFVREAHMRDLDINVSIRSSISQTTVIPVIANGIVGRMIWRCRFPAARDRDRKPCRLRSIVRADQFNDLQSRQGERFLKRRLRHWIGKTRTHGVPAKQVKPICAAADRTGTTDRSVLPAVHAGIRRDSMERSTARDILLEADGHLAYRPCANMGIRHEDFSLSSGGRNLDAFHFQRVNGRCNQFRGSYAVIAAPASEIRYSYSWSFLRVELEKIPLRACLAAAAERSCKRFANGAHSNET